MDYKGWVLIGQIQRNGHVMHQASITWVYVLGGEKEE
jgi:hypothetical protein